jgi:hypothetical protein
MAGVAESNTDAAGDTDWLSVIDGLEMGEDGLGILSGIERHFGERPFSALRFVAFAFVLGVFFLQLGAIEQDDSGYLGGGLGAEDSALESLAYQLGQQAAVVQMRMCQQDRIDALRRHRKGVPVPHPEMSFLVKSAIDEQPRSIGLEQMPRAGDVLGSAEESELNPHIFCLININGRKSSRLAVILSL